MGENKIILKKPISIIIVNYKSEKPLLSCLKKIFLNIKSDRRSEIIVVNNGMENQKTIEKIKKMVKKVINPNENLGFATGVNRGIEIAKNKLILLLNPDTTVSITSINSLIECLNSNKAGIVGGLNYKTNKKKHGTYVRKPNIFTYLFDYTNLRKLVPGDYFHKKHYYHDEPFPTRAKEVDAVSGSFMLINKHVIDTIGLFNEDYFMYLEDVDFCLKAKKAGFKVLFCPKSKIKHIGGYSSKNRERVYMDAWIKSRALYVLKNEGLLVNFLVQPIFMIDKVIIKILQKYKSI